MKPINPLNRHYAFENPGTVYDEEALTALELCARTATKTNECVDAFNKHLGECEDVADKQNAIIRDAVYYMKDNLREGINKTIKELDESGALDAVLQSEFYATPQMYGAKADGVTDDIEAFREAVSKNKRVFVPAGTYLLGDIFEPGDCEIIGATGATLKGCGVQYYGVYYPRLKNITLTAETGYTDALLTIVDSYYGVFDGVRFVGGELNTKYGVFLDGTGDDNGVYYQRFHDCVFSDLGTGVWFHGIANANTVEKCVFYNCSVCIDIDGGENENIINNTFQSFRVSGIVMKQTSKGHTISSLIMGNYFEANANSTGYDGDINMKEDVNVTGNFIIGNHYTYTESDSHVVDMVSRNTVVDYYHKQESNSPNTLMGFTALEPVPDSYKNYGGERFHGTLAPMETQDGNDSNLYFYGLQQGQYGWRKVLTTGNSENDTVTLPPIISNSINQYTNGYIKIGTDYTGTVDKAVTFDTNQQLLKVYINGAWDFYQKVESGTTSNRPTWKPRGYMYYDSTLGKPVWSTGSNTWVDATGATV